MLFLRHCTSLTGDPRDKIYSFVAMAANTGRTGYTGREGLDIQPNYGASVEDVYRDLAMRILSKERTLAILYVPRDPAAPTKLNLPSWVPHLSISTETLSLTGVEMNFGHDYPYMAAAESQCFPQFRNEESLLGLSGFIFDVVNEIGETAEMELGRTEGVDFSQSIISAFAGRKHEWRWHALAGLSQTKRYVTGEGLAEANWKTLIASWTPTQMVTAQQKQQLFQAWLRGSRKEAYIGRLPWPLFEMAIILDMTLTGCQTFFRLICCLLFWKPEQKFDDVMACLVNRRLFRTVGGYMGIGYDATKVGDAIAVCEGGRLPLVVRKEGDGWRLIGDCYVHGIMHAEAYAETKCQLMWLV